MQNLQQGHLCFMQPDGQDRDIIGRNVDADDDTVTYLLAKQETLNTHFSSSKNLVLLHHLLNPLELLMVQLQKKNLHPSDAMFTNMEESTSAGESWKETLKKCVNGSVLFSKHSQLSAAVLCFSAQDVTVEQQEQNRRQMLDANAKYKTQMLNQPLT
uniref:Uncharacterized protein n=1 Tax=Romanomermis culicivorax TaxID=13658 RepID=A0A915J9W2_ROMCU